MDLKKRSLEITKVDRDSFLRKALSAFCPPDLIEKAIQGDCVAQLIDSQTLHTASDEWIKKRCMYVGGIALSTSICGAAGTLLLLPIDFAQFAYHAAKLSQELYYLYGKKDSFHYTKSDDLDLLMVMLIGADGVLTLSSASLSVIGQKLYEKICKKLSLKGLAALPFVGSAVHGSMSAYALYSLADEYREKLIEMNEQSQAASGDEIVKEIGQFIDVEYHEAEEKLRHFCNLERLRQLYMYLENGYINQQEFEQLRLNL